MNKICLFLLFIFATMQIFADKIFNQFGKEVIEKKLEFRYIQNFEVPVFIEDGAFFDINNKINFVINPTKSQKDRCQAFKNEYKAPTGLSFLLYGAPGTGKTEMAKYIAYKNNYLFTMIRQEDFKSSHVGQTEINLANIIRQVEKTAQKQPVVVLFDEIDSYIFNRDGWGIQQHSVDLVNAFLQHLEVLNRNPNVIIFGTTNRYSGLDQAAIRPGRFNYHVEVCYADENVILSYLDSILPLEIFVNQDSKKQIMQHIIKGKNFSYAYLGLLTEQLLEAYIKTGVKISHNDFVATQPKRSFGNLVRELKEKVIAGVNDKGTLERASMVIMISSCIFVTAKIILS